MAKKLPRWMLVPALGLVGWAAVRALGGGSGSGTSSAHPYPPPANRGVPFAPGGATVWPIAANSRASRKYEVPYKDVNGQWRGNSSRAFKASRDGRFHAGVDLYANGGDVLVSPGDGVVVGRQTFLNGTGAMLIALDSGIVVLLGETKMGGAAEFGVVVGSRVHAGQPVTRVGVTNAGSHMLHIETYRKGTVTNEPWYKDRSPPPELLDPTNWLLAGKARSPGA